MVEETAIEQEYTTGCDEANGVNSRDFRSLSELP